MEQPRTHGQKKNTKTVPATLNIGAGTGSFGFGGIVLLGGALVTATIVSVLAFKRSKRHQSSSENINKDFSADFSPLENPSDGVTSMMETGTKTSQNLSKDEKYDSGIGNDEKVESEDSNEDLMFAIGQENTSVHVDSVFENREVETSYEKLLLECEERVVMETQIEDNSCLEKEDGGEEKRYSMIINNGNDEIADEKSLVSDESVTSIEEYEAIEGVEAEEGVVRDITTESSQDHVPSANRHETVLMNEETACVNLVEVHDHHHAQLNEEEKDLSDETCFADQIVYEVAIEEKTIDADCVRQTEVQNGPLVPLLDCEDAIIMQNCVGDLSKQCSSEQVIGQKEMIKEDCVDVVDMEDMLEMDDHKVALDVQEKQVSKDRETFAITRITNSLKGAIDDQTIVKEDKSPAQSVMEETKEDLTAVQVEAETITEDELVKKERISKEDEIPHVKSIEEDVEVRSNKSSDELEDSSMTSEPKISNHNNEENMEENLTILGRVQNDSDQNGILKDDKGSTSSSKFLIELAKAKKQVLASESWNIKLMTWSLLVSIWCLCHWYSELPYPELSLVGSLFFVLILLGYRNSTTYLV